MVCERSSDGQRLAGRNQSCAAGRDNHKARNLGGFKSESAGKGDGAGHAFHIPPEMLTYR